MLSELRHNGGACHVDRGASMVCREMRVGLPVATFACVYVGEYELKSVQPYQCCVDWSMQLLSALHCLHLIIVHWGHPLPHVLVQVACPHPHLELGRPVARVQAAL